MRSTKYASSRGASRARWPLKMTRSKQESTATIRLVNLATKRASVFMACSSEKGSCNPYSGGRTPSLLILFGCGFAALGYRAKKRAGDTALHLPSSLYSRYPIARLRCRLSEVRLTAQPYCSAVPRPLPDRVTRLPVLCSSLTVQEWVCLHRPERRDRRSRSGGPRAGGGDIGSGALSMDLRESWRGNQAPTARGWMDRFPSPGDIAGWPARRSVGEAGRRCDWTSTRTWRTSVAASC